MTARYEAGKAEAKATLEAQRAAAADAQAAISQAAEAKLSKLQLQVCHIHASDMLINSQFNYTLVSKTVDSA